MYFFIGVAYIARARLSTIFSSRFILEFKFYCFSWRCMCCLSSLVNFRVFRQTFVFRIDWKPFQFRIVTSRGARVSIRLLFCISLVGCPPSTASWRLSCLIFPAQPKTQGLLSNLEVQQLNCEHKLTSNLECTVIGHSSPS